MSSIGELTYELLKKVHADFSDVRHAQASLGASLSALERHGATISGDLARTRVVLGGIRMDVSQIKRRLDLVDA